jgi:hypothetical protein
MIAALCNQNCSPLFTVVGRVIEQFFEIWLETSLIPTLVTGQVVVMDNAPS